MEESNPNKQLLLLLLVTTAALQATALHIDKAQVTTPCHAATYLRHISTRAGATLRDSLGCARAATEKAAQVKALAASKQAVDRAAATIIATELERQAHAALQTVLANLEAITNGIAAAGRLSGGQELLEELKGTEITDYAKKRAADAVTDGQALKAEPQIKPAQHGSCKNEDGWRTDLPKAGTATTGTKTTITLLTGKAATPGANPGEALTLCGRGSTGAIAGRSSCTSTHTVNLGLKGGEIFTTAAATATRDNDEATTEYKISIPPTHVPSQKTVDPDLTDIKKLEDAIRSIDKITAQLDLEQIANSAALKATAAKAIGGESASYSDSAIQAQVDSLLKELFGDKAANVKTNLVQGLDNTKPPKAATGGSGEQKLAEIKDPKELSDAQIYYTVTGYIADQEQKKKNQASPSCLTKTSKPEEPPKSADECKKHKTSDACKEGGCEFDEKKEPKCFPKLKNEKKNEKYFLKNLKVSVLQVFSAIALSEFYNFKKFAPFYEIYEIC
uniref:Variant surface glycoprotein 719 n=1 Tax=Trypanosoma brucei TaxID=5691 RepID=M4SV69_9TRYP|nr:variant surface glycoprotein 719 [Trypanosoma brucei]